MERIQFGAEPVRIGLEIMRSYFDHLILDLRHDLDPGTVTALELSDVILFITSLDVPSIRSAWKRPGQRVASMPRRTASAETRPASDDSSIALTASAAFRAWCAPAKGSVASMRPQRVVSSSMCVPPAAGRAMTAPAASRSTGAPAARARSSSTANSASSGSPVRKGASDFAMPAFSAAMPRGSLPRNST
jgi:hypothetical protein